MAGETTFTVTGIAVPDALEELHDLIARIASVHPDVLLEDLSMMELAIIELAGNLIEHGRPPGEVGYELTLTVHPDRLEGTLRDSGDPIDHAADQPREMPDVLAESGRGLLLAVAVLDECTYLPRPQDNTWRLVRLRRPTPLRCSA